MDHIVIDLNFRDKTNSSLAVIRGESLKHAPALMKALFQYRMSGRGPLTTNVSQVPPVTKLRTVLSLRIGR